MLWKDMYTLGVDNIDKQHMELFKRVETFVKTLRSSTSWNEKVKQVNETLEFMQAYVIEHFHAEEAYQRQIGYPGYQAHKEIHENMVKYVQEVNEEYERSGYDEQLIQKFAGKLLAWLINHVAAEDQRIASYAKTKEDAGNDK